MAYPRKNSFRQFPFCTFALTPITDLPGPTDLLARFTGNQHPAHCGIFLLHHRSLYRLQDSYLSFCLWLIYTGVWMLTIHLLINLMMLLTATMRLLY